MLKYTYESCIIILVTLIFICFGILIYFGILLKVDEDSSL